MPNRIYTTEPLMTVDSLRLTPCGVFGMLMDGGEIIDVHHIDHPNSRNRGNENGVSLNFTAHYDKMRARFGNHILNGDAGENILVESENVVALDDLGVKIAIEDMTTGKFTHLTHVIAAPPCVEFSYYVLNKRENGAIIKETLQFLDDGTRGFYMTLGAESEHSIIHTGDKVYAVD